jgi:hypothetical protein
MRTVVLFALAAGLLPAADNGVRPRVAPSDYAAHQAAGGITVAAAVVPPDQVAKLFATDLNKGGYVVLEVAVYPEAGRDADVRARDFLLRAGNQGTTVRPVSADAIASILQQKNSPKPQKPPGPHDITLYPTATIGYESGGYDPVTGRRGGVYTAAGVGVAVGAPQQPPAPPRPASTTRDRDTMRQELADNGLPEGRATAAVAGYLYFPKPGTLRKGDVYNVTWYGETGQMQLAVPAGK